MQISFILYKPATPGNIGAAARAIKTMGFSDLRLIDPCDHLAEEAKMFAHGSLDILKNARVFHGFEESISDLDFTIATTAKKRSAKEDYLEASKLSHFLNEKEPRIKKAGIVFGTEESGLPNEIIASCDAASSIAMKTKYPSLNLGQAVMLYAYELAGLKSEPGKSENGDTESFPELKKRIAGILINIGIPEEMPLHSRILERISHMNGGDINLLHSVSARLAKFLEEKD